MSALGRLSRGQQVEIPGLPLRAGRALASKIKKDIADNRIFVYAKGEKNMAMCGFSNRVMEVFNRLGAPYEVRNIFSDPELRPALCAFTQWPTTPQVFVDGNFIGGAVISRGASTSSILASFLRRSSAWACFWPY